MKEEGSEKKNVSVDLPMREPIIFYCWDTFFYDQNKRGKESSGHYAMFYDFRMLGKRPQAAKRFWIKIFIIHLRAADTHWNKVI